MTVFFSTKKIGFLSSNLQKRVFSLPVDSPKSASPFGRGIGAAGTANLFRHPGRNAAMTRPGRHLAISPLIG